MVKPGVLVAGILRQGCDRSAQNALAVGFAAEPAIEIRKIDRGRRELRAQPQCRPIFGLGFHRPAAARKEIAERGARLRAIRILALGGDEFRRRSLEPLAVGGRLARARNRGEQRNGPNPHAADRIRQERRHHRPEAAGGEIFQHVERADPHHRVRVRQACLRQFQIGRRCVGREFAECAGAGDCRRIAVGRHGRQQPIRRRLIAPGGTEGCRIGLKTLAARTMPLLNRRRRPLRRLIGMAIGAGIRRAKLDRNIRPRNPEAVVVPPVHHHVGARRHVARAAGHRRGHPLVAMMAGARIAAGVALQTDAIHRRA